MKLMAQARRVERVAPAHDVDRWDKVQGRSFENVYNSRVAGVKNKGQETEGK